MVKISVIIPIYNVEEYLEVSLESILKQSFKDIEVICVNDGSTDKSLDILNSYAKNDSRIKIINQKNQGASISRNNALKHVSGEYIYFFDADDYICFNGLEKLYLSVTTTNSDFAIFKSIVFFNEFSDGYNSNICDIDSLYPKADFNNLTFTHRDIKNFVLNNSNAPWNKLYKKEFLDKYGDFEFPPKLPYNDVIFHVKSMLRASKISFVPEYLYYYRKNNPNSISNDDSNHIKIFKIIKLVEDFLINEEFMDEYKQEFELFKLEHILYHMKFPLSKEYFNLAKKEFLKIDIQNNNLINENNLEKYEVVMNLNSDEISDFENKLTFKTLENKHKHLIDKHEEIKLLNTELNKKLETEKNLYEDLLLSNSWRMTKPLRVIRNCSFKEKLLNQSNSYIFYKNKYDVHQKQEKKFKRDIKLLNKDLVNKRMKINSLQNNLINKQNEITSLQEKLINNQNKINSLLNDNKKLNNELNELKNLIDQKNKKLEEY